MTGVVEEDRGTVLDEAVGRDAKMVVLESQKTIVAWNSTRLLNEQLIASDNEYQQDRDKMKKVCHVQKIAYCRRMSLWHMNKKKIALLRTLHVCCRGKSIRAD